MIRLHCTQKLLAQLPLDESGRLPEPPPSYPSAGDDEESLLSGWHGHVLSIQRRHCVLLIHGTTRFPVFIPALKKPDLAKLDLHFAHGFMNTLLKSGADDQLMDGAQRALSPLVCDAQCNRSVQATMNQMAQDLRHLIDHQQIDVANITGYRIGAWLADRPCTVKGRNGFIWPQQAMHELLGNTFGT